MKLLVISYKRCWKSPSSKYEYVTIGGFPLQMRFLSSLFDETSLRLPIQTTPRPSGALPITGHNLRIETLSEPQGDGFRRKLALLAWFPSNIQKIWHSSASVDAVHTPVPGDIGALGLLVALVQRKPLFVRHCGTWGKTTTLADRFLNWLLPRIAGGRNVVMATGGSPEPPSSTNPYIQWIFSTSLTQAEMHALPQAPPWTPGEPLRLVTVGRLSASKNTLACIRALPTIKESYSDATLAVVGDGEMLPTLQEEASRLAISDQVTFLGNLAHDGVLRVLSDSHVFLFPTRTKEGFPKAVLEAMACGLPVIASRVSVLPHLVGDRCGIILPATDARSVVDAVLEILDDPQKLAQIGRIARQTAQGYTLEAWRDTIGERLRKAWGPLRMEKG